MKQLLLATCALTTILASTSMAHAVAEMHIKLSQCTITYKVTPPSSKTPWGIFQHDKLYIGDCAIAEGWSQGIGNTRIMITTGDHWDIYTNGRNDPVLTWIGTTPAKSNGADGCYETNAVKICINAPTDWQRCPFPPKKEE
jgi:hypothetical protein